MEADRRDKASKGLYGSVKVGPKRMANLSSDLRSI